MSKYIIELKDDVQVVQKVGVTENGNAFVMNFYKDQLEELNSDYINEHYGDLQDTAYKKGLHDGESKCRYCNEYQRGFEDGKKTPSELASNAEYQRGLNDAWECGKKLAWTAKYGGYGERLSDVFGRDDTFDFYDYTPNEAIEKLKAFEQKQDKIEVGDIVNIKDGKKNNGIITKSWGNYRYFIVWSDGSGGVWDKEYLVKTGRHFDIAKILEEMRHD